MIDVEKADMKVLSKRALALSPTEELKDLIEAMYWKYVNDVKNDNGC